MERLIPYLVPWSAWLVGCGAVYFFLKRLSNRWEKPGCLIAFFLPLIGVGLGFFLSRNFVSLPIGLSAYLIPIFQLIVEIDRHGSGHGW